MGGRRAAFPTMRIGPLVAEEDFLRLPESMDKVELVDGEVLIGPPEGLRHQRIKRLVVLALTSWEKFQTAPPFIGQSPLDVRFAPGRILQPDLFLICGPVDESAPLPLTRVPDLCIEILGTDRVHDRVTKRLIYAAAGVIEYWVIDPNGYVERFSGPGLADVDSNPKALESPLLPGFSLPFAALDTRFA